MMTAQVAVAVFASASQRLVLLAPYCLIFHLALFLDPRCLQGQDVAAQALHVRLDALPAAGSQSLIAPIAADGHLLRRLSLDVRGVVPTGEELDAFIADRSADRWQTWVARFLSDPLCDEHLLNFLDRTLMLRRAHVNVDRTSWLNYLREHIANNTPLDQLSAELLNTPWWNVQQRVAQKFYVDRGGDPHLIARDVGRIFLGRDLQCAQCHDHPNIDDYLQADYHGLLAFFTPSKLAEATYKDAEGKEQKIQLYVEASANDAAFESVFNKGVAFRSGPRLPAQVEQFEEYLMPGARLNASAAADALPGVPPSPVASRRHLLAKLLASRDNPRFVSNWSNRLWALVFGRGLVHPLDMQHCDNPPANPALFELLAEGLVAVDMQPRRFIEQLVLSQVYQRGGFPAVLPEGDKKLPSLDSTTVEPLRFDVQARLDALAIEHDSLRKVDSQLLAEFELVQDNWREIQKTRGQLAPDLEAAEAAMLSQQGKSNEANAALAAAQKRKSDAQAQLALLVDSSAKLKQAIDLAAADDISQAFGIVNARVQALNDGMPEIEKALAEAQSKADAEVASYQQATAQVQKLVTEMAPIHEKLMAADHVMLAARLNWSGNRSKLVHIERSMARWQRIRDWIDRQLQMGVLNGRLAERLLEPAAIVADQAQLVEHNQPSDIANDDHAKLKAELHELRSTTTAAWLGVIDDCVQNLETTGLYPLTPEQLCWSTLRLTGQLDTHIRVELAELDKQLPLDADAKDEAKASRYRQAVRAAFDKLRGNADVFTSLYASGPDKTHDEFFASADQALFVANAGSVYAWAAAGNNNVTQQAIQLTGGQEIANLLYWAVLCRRPSEREVQIVTEQLMLAGESRNQVIQEMVWGILASAEFRFCQ